jgi:hypothetical protein
MTLVLLVPVIVLMIMMVRFVMLVVITGLRRRTTRSSDTEHCKSDQYFFHSQWSLNDTDFSEHQKFSGHSEPKSDFFGGNE